jgi:hypothetical protein
MQFKLVALTALLGLAQVALAFPKVNPQEFKRLVEEAADQRPEIRDLSSSTLPRSSLERRRFLVSFTIRRIQMTIVLTTPTDAAHPFRAPGPKDMRGPCRKLLSELLRVT